jgi:hypothetical protein
MPGDIIDILVVFQRYSHQNKPAAFSDATIHQSSNLY